jgi:hypothetical protein
MKLTPSIARWLALAALAATGLLMAGSSPANTVTVTNLADSGPGSLRNAIADTAANGAINFQAGLTGTMTLTGGELDIGRNLTITGPNAGDLTIYGNTNGRVFNILANATVNISGLTISGGLALGTNGDIGGPGQGGGILNAGTLLLTNCIITGNTAQGGNGEGGPGGDGLGGGIFSTGYLAMTGCTVSYNSASGQSFNQNGGYGSGCGGGVNVTGGGFLFINCTIASNSATGENTGMDAPTGDGKGGGVYISNLQLSPEWNFECCTVSGNGSVGGSSSGYEPGGDGLGGGLCVDGNVLPVMANTIVSGNSVVAGSSELQNGTAAGPDVNGGVESEGFNLIGEMDGSSAWNGSFGWIGSDLTGTIAAPLDPQLGPLQDNGGPTPTMALAPSSAAINQGYSFGVTTDQRGYGYFRPYDFPNIPNAPGGDGTDIGAYELNPLGPSLIIFPNFATTLASLLGGIPNIFSANILAVVWTNSSPGRGEQTSMPVFKLQKKTLMAGHSLGDGEWTDFQQPVRLFNNLFVARDSYATDCSFYRLIGPASNTTFTPSPSTLPATQVSSNSAALNGTGIPVGNSTTYWFEYGGDTNYGQTGPQTSMDTSTNPASLSCLVSGLNPLTLYHFQLVVMDDWGTQYGGDQTLTTAGPPPAVVTLAATNIGMRGAVLNGSVNGNGSLIAGYFQYGLTTSYGSTTQTNQFYGTSPSSTQDFSTSITGLSQATTYHYRIVAYNEWAEAAGADDSFTTTVLIDVLPDP